MGGDTLRLTWSSWRWSSGAQENVRIKDTILEVISTVIFTLIVQVLRKRESEIRRESKTKSWEDLHLLEHGCRE